METGDAGETMGERKIACTLTILQSINLPILEGNEATLNL